MFSLGLLLAAVLPVLVSCVVILPKGQRGLIGASMLKRPSVHLATIRRQFPGMVSSLLATTYKQLPLVLIAAVAPEAAPAYAVADRLWKFGMASLKPLAQIAQGWTPSAGRSMLTKRIRKAVLLTAIAALLSGIGFSILGPIAAAYLGNSSIEMNRSTFMLLGIALASSMISQVTGLAGLMALGADGAVAWSAIAGALICLFALLVQTDHLHVTGAALSVALAEVGVLAVQLTVLYRKFKLGS